MSKKMKDVISIYDVNTARRPYKGEDGRQVEEIRVIVNGLNHVQLSQIPATIWAALVEEIELFEDNESADVLKVDIRVNSLDCVDISIEKEEHGGYWAYTIAELNGVFLSEFKTINHPDELLSGSFTERFEQPVYCVEFQFGGRIYVPTTEQEKEHIEKRPQGHRSR